MEIKGELLIWKSKGDNDRPQLIPGVPGALGLSRADITGHTHKGLLISPFLREPLRLSGSSPEDIRDKATRAVRELHRLTYEDILEGSLTQQKFSVCLEP